MSDYVFDITDINSYMLQQKVKFNQELGANLRKMRKLKKVSLNELSNKTMISSTYLSQIEKGEYGISLFKFVTLCNTLETNIEDLLENFIIGSKINEDILIEKLQEKKDISSNILEYMKYK